MSSTKHGSEIKQLFRETKFRYPNQAIEAETAQGWLEDWRDLSEEVGFPRFAEGVKRARSYCKFFPQVGDIREYLPAPHQPEGKWLKELAELERRKKVGEKFYTLADVILEFCRRVEAGEIKGKTVEENQRMKAYAQRMQKDAKTYAEKMLAESCRKRPKSDFRTIAEGIS